MSGKFASMAEVDVAVIDRCPPRFYRGIVSPNGPQRSLQPQGRGTGHAKHSPRAEVTFRRFISIKSVTVLATLECT